MDPDDDVPSEPVSLEEVIRANAPETTFVLRVDPTTGPERKLEIVPIAEGDNWKLLEYEHNGCRWRVIGSERVDGFCCKTETNHPE